MNDPEIVKLLVRKDERITALQEQNHKLREVLSECATVLEWHLDKSQPQNSKDQSDFFNQTANAISQAHKLL